MLCIFLYHQVYCHKCSVWFFSNGFHSEFFPKYFINVCRSVFILVLNGSVHIRDWREEKLPRKNKLSKHPRHRLSSKALKTRLCWFYIHHPHGCPLTSESCPFAHGAEELRPSQTVSKKIHVWQQGEVS